MGWKIKEMSLGKEGGIYCCLKLGRKISSTASSAEACSAVPTLYLWRGRKDLCADLWSRCAANGLELRFQQELSECTARGLRDSLNQAVDHLVSKIRESGG